MDHLDALTRAPPQWELDLYNVLLLTRHFAITVLFIVLGSCLSDAYGAGQPYSLRDGKELSKEDLNGLLNKQADASGGAAVLDLAGASLRFLRDLDSKNFNHINFNNANLEHANLRGVTFTECTFAHSILTSAGFDSAEFRNSVLERVSAEKATFNNIHVTSHFPNQNVIASAAHLEETVWNSAQLDGVKFIECHLEQSKFGQWIDDDMRYDLLENHPPASLRKAQFVADPPDDYDEPRAPWGDPTNLADANFDGCDLTGATFVVVAERVRFDNADLTDASLWGTFTNASFKNSNLTHARLSGDFTGAWFEPGPGQVPYLPSLVSVRGLESLRYKNSPQGLTELRAALRAAGMRNEERKVSYSILRERYDLTRQRGNLAEFWFNRVLFDLPCGYGLYPWRPLLILAGGVFVFACLYLPFVVFRSRTGRSGIWKVRLETVVHKRRRTRPIRMALAPSKKGLSKIRRLLTRIDDLARATMVAFYFSVLTAFNIGFREINLGSWILRLQTREHNLRATGWVRFLAGCQSLLSVYLVALWLLTYFGRPFE